MTRLYPAKTDWYFWASSTLAAMCLALVVLIMLALIDGFPGVPRSHERPRGSSEERAWNAVRSFIKKGIPDADFGQQTAKGNVRQCKDGTFAVSGWCDFENKFGRVVRLSWLYEVRRTAGGWECRLVRSEREKHSGSR